MESLLLGAPGGDAAAGAPGRGAGGVDGPAVAGAGELVPGVVFVGASDALGRVTALVETLVTELAGLSLAGAGWDVLRSLVAALGRVRAGADAAEARAVTAAATSHEAERGRPTTPAGGGPPPGRGHTTIEDPAETPTTPVGRNDAGEPAVPPRRQPVPPRRQPVIVASADVVTGKDPQGRCEIPGIGPIPQSELERLACDAELFGVLFSGDGDPLWHGRGERTVTDAQRRALLTRDGVCVLCADEPARCESHHIVPWAKPGEGPTDIDNLALLCGTCHRRLHNRKRVLTRSPDGAWGTAPDPRHARRRRHPVPHHPGHSNTPVRATPASGTTPARHKTPARQIAPIRPKTPARRTSSIRFCSVMWSYVGFVHSWDLDWQ